MRRLARWTFNHLALISFLLLAATAWLWVRNYNHPLSISAWLPIRQPPPPSNASSQWPRWERPIGLWHFQGRLDLSWSPKELTTEYGIKVSEPYYDQYAWTTKLARYQYDMRMARRRPTHNILGSHYWPPDSENRDSYLIIPDQTIAAAFAVLPLLWLALASRRAGLWLLQARRRRRGLCPKCGYDLRASDGRCPECGAPAGTKPQTAAV